MANMTQSSVAGILKELYDDQKIQWLTYKDNPTLAMMKKEEKFPGKYFPVPVVYGLSQGASATFSSAYNNQSSPTVAEFLVTRVADFSLATIDGQLLAAAQTDPGAFIDGAELMIEPIVLPLPCSETAQVLSVRFQVLLTFLAPLTP
jgi:hypothetical protein